MQTGPLLRGGALFLYRASAAYVILVKAVFQNSSIALVTGRPLCLARNTGRGIFGVSGMTAMCSGLNIRTLLPASRLIPTPMSTALRMDSTRAVRRILGEKPASRHRITHRL